MEIGYEELFADLYDYANRRYATCPEREVLIQEAFVALIVKQKKDGPVESPKAFLRTVLSHKHNDWLRRQYRDAVVTYEFPELAAPEEEEDRSEEMAAVRREVGRLIRIYREVAVRHYMHGHSVERIAHDLGIPKGTVLSRLSTARRQLKGRLESMKTYSEYSYEPKRLHLGIHGGTGLRGEPFTLVASPIEQNVLILSYEHPLSVQALADTMGMPCAYLEPIVDKLVNGELLGRTSGGLVYTRCFIQHEQDRFGNVAAQEALANRYADDVWQIVWRHIEPLMMREQVTAMSEKQKATLVLFAMDLSLNKALMKTEPHREYPERPNGGKWLAIGTFGEANDASESIYESSGPCTHQRYDAPRYRVFDFQSCFGDTHWKYPTFRYRLESGQIARFFASFFVKEPDVHQPIVELIPDFEELHILKRDENGEAVPDFPALTWDEYHELWEPATNKIAEEVFTLLKDEFESIRKATKHRVPAHVDQAETFTHFSAFRAYAVAQMLSIVNKGLMPYTVELGKTPILFVVYDNQ